MLDSDSKTGAGRGASRDVIFDIVKGISIMEVMLHHLLSFSAARYYRDDFATSSILMLVHKSLHFAVPTFLMLSALLLAKSLRRNEKPDWARFYKRRAARSLLPYLLWTAIYLAFRIRFVHVLREVEETPIPFAGITLHIPALLVDVAEWRANLFWGKAWYHLYFLSVLLQFYLVIPALFALFKRNNRGFCAVVVASAIVQVVIYWVNATFLYPILGFTTPASSILWYAPPILIGTWLGFYWEVWETTWKRTRVQICALCAVSFAVYLFLDLAESRGASVNSYVYNAALTAYTTCIALLLLRTGKRLANLSIGLRLQRLGSWSLPLFLIHPMTLYFAGSPRLNSMVVRLPFPIIWTGGLMFGGAWALAWALMRLHLDVALFGRKLSNISGD